MCPEACGFRDVVVEPASCLGDTAYTIDLEFVPVSVNDDGFSLFAYGQNLGSFAYSDLPVLGVPYPASGDFFDTLVICDNLDPECCDTIQFQALLCEQCVIYDMEVIASECDENDQFTVEINFQSQNTGESGFQIGGNGTVYGTFQYEDLPIELGPLDGDNVTFWEFAVFDNENPFCIQGVELGVINCINPCEIGALEVDAIGCTGDGFYQVNLDFDFANTDSAGFNLFANGNFFGSYSYSDLPLTIDSFPSSGNTNDIIRVEDAGDESCAAVAEFESLGCFLICDIRDIVVAPIECTSDSTFSALVTFIFENLETDFVDIYSGDDYLGFFNVNNLPVLVDGFTSSFFEVPIEICANDNELCCESRNFQGISCDTSCSVSDLVSDLTECEDDGTYDAVINFSAEGFTSVNARVIVNDGEPELYPVNDLPVVLKDLPGDGEQVSVIVCDNDNLDCCEDISWTAPVCAIDTCDIRDAVLSEVECQGDGTYNARLDFIFEGLISSFVNVSLGDSLIGLYPADSVPLLIKGLPGNGADDVLVICDNDNPECCAELPITAPECEVVCSVVEVATENVECLGNGTFAVTVNFVVQGFENELADVFVEGELFASVEVSAGTTRLVGLEGDGSDIEISVCENDNGDCCGSTILSTPVCEGCSISELVIDVNECTSDSTFSAWLNYELVGIDTAGVTVYANGDFIGQFPAISPLLVSNIPANGEMVTLEICGQDTLRSLPCCVEEEIEALLCEEPGCPILSVTVQASECDTAGQFNAIIEADIEGEPTGGFIVAGNGMTYGSFGYDELPLTIGPLDGDGETEWEFILIDISDPSCSGSVELGQVNCDPNSLFEPSAPSRQLEIRYDAGRPFLLVPEDDLTMSILNYAGQEVTLRPAGASGDRIDLTTYSSTPGLFIAVMQSNGVQYVGRFVISE